MRARSLLICLCVCVLAACDQKADGYGFAIKDVSVSRGYQSLNIHIRQQLSLSEQALEALHHGVTLTIRLDLELRNDNNMIVVRRETRRFKVRYLPLNELYELLGEETVGPRTFPRLRHVFAAIDDLYIQLPTGPLPQGNYQLRTRILLDEGQLPSPMQLPVLFSSQWRHNSEWSTWPFKVSA